MDRIETQWAALTGAPTSGKTTVLKQLSVMRLPIRREFASRFINKAKRDGQTLEQIAADQQKLQSALLKGGLEEDALLDTARPYFLDRTPVDAVAHYMLRGLKGVEEAIVEASRFRYKKVFYFEPLPFQHDGVRIEKSHEEAAQLHILFKRAYEAAGYEVIDVPRISDDIDVSVRERIALIMDHLKV